MTYDVTDWRHYLKSDEVEQVEDALREAAYLKKKKNEALMSIHHIRNAACQRRRYAIGNVRNA